MSHGHEDGRRDRDKYYKRNNDERDQYNKDRDRNRNRDRDKDRDRDRDQDRDRDRDQDKNRNYKSSRTSNHDRFRNDRKRRYSEEFEDRNDRRPKKEYGKKYEWGKTEKNSPPVAKVKEKEKPNFQTTGKLAEETNTFRGVVIKYSEPPEARKPKRRWRLYPFKGEKLLPLVHLKHSGYLIGRDRKIADFAIDHPSCSKQHAAFQFRLVPMKTESGSVVQQIRPYIMDLESANGTFLNGKRIEPRKYYELFEKDVLKFGFSSREYVLLHEHSTDAIEDDDINENDNDNDAQE